MTHSVDREALGILGAGRHAKELADYCGRTVRFFAVSESLLDRDDTRVALERPPHSLIDTPVAIGVGAPALKRSLLHKWPGDQFATVITENSFLARSARIAAGTVLAPFSAVMAGSSLGSHVLVSTSAVISHDCVVGDFVTISPGVNVGGSCTIGPGAFIGIGATLKDGVRVGEGAVIGAGAVVINDVADREVVVGVPARRISVASDWLWKI